MCVLISSAFQVVFHSVAQTAIVAYAAQWPDELRSWQCLTYRCPARTFGMRRSTSQIRSSGISAFTSSGISPRCWWPATSTPTFPISAGSDWPRRSQTKTSRSTGVPTPLPEASAPVSNSIGPFPEDEQHFREFMSFVSQQLLTFLRRWDGGSVGLQGRKETIICPVSLAVALLPDAQHVCNTASLT